MNWTRSPHGRHGRARRRGAAVIELAVCLPTLVFVLLMALEAADVIFLKQTLHIAAYESARAAIRPKSTTAGALAPGDQILTDRQVQEYEIQFNPEDVAQVPRGQRITVTVTAGINQNTVLSEWYPSQQSLVAQVKMNKE